MKKLHTKLIQALGRPANILQIVAVGVVFAFTVGGATYFQQRTTSHIDSNTKRIALLTNANQRNLLQGCKRLNILLVSQNRSQYADYLVFTTVITLFKKTGQRSNPLITQLQYAIAQKSWTPLSDCDHAVNTHGAAYRAPAPIAFAHELPPRVALTP